MLPFPSLKEILISLCTDQSATGTSKELMLEKHIDATVDWLIRASVVNGNGGISKGYSLLRGQWAASYPETTGYSIPTLLNVAAVQNRPELKSYALNMAEYLLKAMTQEGWVKHFRKKAANSPIVFDTGQAIFGWLAAFAEGGHFKYLNAATRAGNWLVKAQDSSGAWNRFQHLGLVKVIDTRVAWALLELYQRTSEERYRESAIRNLEWALIHQDESGWFANCSLVPKEDPLSHTIAYTVEGFLESGKILGEGKYLNAARRTADRLRHLQYPDGRISASFRKGWRESSRTSCLTGQCQIACIWMRMIRIFPQENYLSPSELAIAFVARTQNLRTADPNIRGAVAGSFPIFGRYERFKYPNWAAKFFLDALLELKLQRNPNQYVQLHPG